MALTESKEQLTKGFTLIELLVVIAIVGLLASIVLASVGIGRDRARTTRLNADFRTIETAIEIARSDRGVLLVVTGSGCSDCICRGVANIHTLPASHACIQSLTNAFVTKVGMPALPRDPWGNPYTVDENEHEGGSTDCTYDALTSPGPDHMRDSTDDISYTVRHHACVP